jgi:Predicted membrane protein
MQLPDEVKSSWITLFLSTMVLCSVVEYLASWQMEKIFHMKWWDYSDHRFNLKGRICLLNSVLFGIMGIITVHFVQPVVDYFVFKLNETVTVYLAAVLGVVFVCDIIVTVNKLSDFNTTMAKLKEFGESLKERYSDESWFRSTSMMEMFSSIKERALIERDMFSKGLLQKIDFFSEHRPNEERFVIRFPRLSSASYKESLGLVKQHIMDGIAEKKAALRMKKHEGE